MKLYPVIKNLLFSLDPETAHHLTLKSLQIAYRLRLSKLFPQPNIEPHHVMGLSFPHKIGLAAGFDKNADYVDALSQLGFAFIEVGTLTPKPQAGNDKPRLFRLPEAEAIINRMGFCNKGVEHAVQKLSHIKYKGILGINIGKNKNTDLDHAVDDYLFCFNALWPYASYFTINISSPNTPGLRDLQKQAYLNDILNQLKNAQQQVNMRAKKYIPLVIKISPDLRHEELDEICEVLLKQEVDGVIATNTSVSRQGVETLPHAQEVGGLSGRPLHDKSLDIIQLLSAAFNGKIAIIASGGNSNQQNIQEKIAAGAHLIQVYTGLIYQGPDILTRQ